jgi:hypothetical protein
MTLDKKFREAISQLPSAEKDKLIFRLLKKDENFANKLYFELMPPDSKDERRQQVKTEIDNMINLMKQHSPDSSPGLLLLNIKETFGIVADYVKMTGDKSGEIYLRIFVAKEALQLYNYNFMEHPLKMLYKLNIYFVAEVFKIMVLLKKLYKDIPVDIADYLKQTGQLFGDNPGLMETAIYNGLDVNWLTKSKIPDDIAEIEKDLRQGGYF